MKPIIASILFMVCASRVVMAQQSSDVIDLKKHKVVIQFNEADSVSQVRVILQVQNVKTAWPNAEVEVVCLAGGLDLLMTTHSKMSKGVADWSTKGVTFAACNNTMKMRKVKKEDLLNQAVVVPAAIVELAAKQEEGWSYFRGGK